ncbi:hypothetical protein [Actinokineospora bangkokensis]|uniref:Uncharacterized protein n=1 Tax=Actinokineospora bangkokensis TaxID=1193682 RepID=A0A1Q9LR93_9PSEU|nr:hypothetical protein [Actinokineospora bangkokensis]OLR94549.1 hypothetical protein BJP25_12480 [Actinokineospora bangkokensis]
MSLSDTGAALVADHLRGASTPAAARIHDLLTRFGATRGPLSQVQANPDDHLAQSLLGAALDSTVRTHPGLAEEIQVLVEQAGKRKRR